MALTACFLSQVKGGAKMNKAVLIGILVVLAVLALVGTPEKSDSSSRGRRILKSLSPEQVSQINIKSPT